MTRLLPQPIEPISDREDEGNTFTAAWGGLRRSVGAVRNFFNIVTGDNQDVLEQAVKDSQLQPTDAQERFHTELQERMTQGGDETLY